MTDEPNVPLSVQLGEVVPPEDPEDWRKPLTWVVAVGMLAAPLWAAVWFVLAPPVRPVRGHDAGTALLAVAVAAGAAVVGASQRGALRALLGTLGAGLFAALGVIVVASVIGGGTGTGDGGRGRDRRDDRRPARGRPGCRAVDRPVGRAASCRPRSPAA